MFISLYINRCRIGKRPDKKLNYQRIDEKKIHSWYPYHYITDLKDKKHLRCRHNSPNLSLTRSRSLYDTPASQDLDLCMIPQPHKYFIVCIV
jgi:hypothetical protein